MINIFCQMFNPLFIAIVCSDQKLTEEKTFFLFSLPLPHSTSLRFNLGWPCRLSSFDPLILTSVSYVFCSFNLIQPSFIRKASQQKIPFYLFLIVAYIVFNCIYIAKSKKWLFSHLLIKLKLKEIWFFARIISKQILIKWRC